MLYKIKSIKHSGTYGERGTDRTDGRYPLRIDRIVDFDIKDIEVGYPLLLQYIKDYDGTPMKFSLLKTSNIVEVTNIGELGISPLSVIVETENSIFEFERVDEIEEDE